MILDKSEIGSVLQSAIGLAPPIGCITPVFGGCINRSFKLVDNHGLPYFLKINSNHPFPILKPEFVALSELYKLYMEGTGLRVPKPLWHGKILERECLVLEYVPMSSSASTGSWRQLGNDLARLHKIRGPAFGWHIDNFIGSSPQKNTLSQNWVEFWMENRIGSQLSMARSRGYPFPGLDGFMERMPQLFDGHVSEPAWIHGDLWHGNLGFCESTQEPILFDPACYWGDREAEFGIVDMFHGFDRTFFDAYFSGYSKADGFERRLPLYRLYHELNHLNLFGDAYLGAVENTIRQIKKSL